MRLLRQAVFATAIIAGLTIAGQTSTPPDFRILKPGPVIPEGPDSFLLSGKFTVARTTNVTPIENRSYGSGGACIYGDLAKVGAPEVACSSSSQCNQAWANFYEANKDNPKFDTASFGANTTNPGQCIANRCWYRPTPAACARRMPPNSWELGSHQFGAFSVHHVARFFGEDAKIDWQVVTCSNRAQHSGTDDRSCAQGQGIYSPPINVSDSKATDWEARTRSLPSE